VGDADLLVAAAARTLLGRQQPRELVVAAHSRRWCILGLQLLG
jgi:hypothetical protein